MLRLLLLVILAFSSSSVLAASLPSLFTPAENDLSLQYLGAIFGSELLPDWGTETHLMSRIFEIFNQVALTVGLIIIIYTIITGTLNTAGQGKPLGEKWNAVWMPIRMVVGMSLLVPKAGTGYSMAQYLVIWMVIQGVGAADTLWSKILDYFIEGGGIYSETSGGASSYLNAETVPAAYDLERWILINTACVAAHNNSDYKDVFGEYRIYSTDGNYNVNFGNPKAWEAGTGGQECGTVPMPIIVVPADPDQDEDFDRFAQEQLIRDAYNQAFYSMSRGLQDVGKFLAGELGEDDSLWPSQFPIVQSNAVTFIEYLKGARDILFPNENDDQDQMRKDLEELKDYGWILAGNYYMTLSGFSDELDAIEIVVPDNDIETPDRDSLERYADAIKNAEDFWEIKDTNDPRRINTFEAWPDEEKYDAIPGYDVEYTPSEGHRGLTRADMQDIKESLAGRGDVKNGLKIGNHPVLSPMYYIDKVSGVNNGVKQDPILKAAKFGKELTEIAVIMMATSLVGLMLLTYMATFPTCVAPANFFGVLALLSIMGSIIFGIASFLYIQGAMLGVFLPLIPFVIFLVGVLGWFIAVIESIVAAPLVAVGLIFPETKDDIWGRAEPAYMMILNLFLRPSMMVVGFIAGMILTWIAVELLNGAFYFFIYDAARIENDFFGYIVISLAYIAVLMSIVAKSFSLVNEIPNKVLYWIGDKSQGQEGAQEMISSARGGAEKGAQAGGGAISTAGGMTQRTGDTAARVGQRSESKSKEGDVEAETGKK